MDITFRDFETASVSLSSHTLWRTRDAGGKRWGFLTCLALLVCFLFLFSLVRTGSPVVSEEKKKKHILLFSETNSTLYLLPHLTFILRSLLWCSFCLSCIIVFFVWKQPFSSFISLVILANFCWTTKCEGVKASHQFILREIWSDASRSVCHEPSRPTQRVFLRNWSGEETSKVKGGNAWDDQRK